MSEASAPHPVTSRPPSSPLWGFVLPLLGFLAFTVITAFVVWGDGKFPSIDDKRGAERLKILQEYRASEAEKIGAGYGWVDSSKGVVRIPIDRAMAVVLQELQNKPVGPAYPVGSSRAAAASSTPMPSGSAANPAAPRSATLTPAPAAATPAKPAPTQPAGGK